MGELGKALMSAIGVGGPPSAPPGGAPPGGAPPGGAPPGGAPPAPKYAPPPSVAGVTGPALAPPPVAAPVAEAPQVQFAEQAPAMSPDNPGAYADDPNMASVYDSQSLASPNAADGPLGVNMAAQQDSAYGPAVDNTQADFAAQAGDENLDVVGNGFKPRKQNVLEQIADFFLGGALSKGMHGRNMRDATRGFQSDPDAAIRRIQTFDPESALKMYYTRQDDLRADASAESLGATRVGKALMDSRATISAILKEPEEKRAAIYKSWQPRLEGKRNKLGLTDDDLYLPKEYDESALRVSAAGGISPSTQARLEQGEVKIDQKDRSLDQADTGLEIRRDGLNETIDNNDVKAGQRGRSLDQGQERIDIAQGNQNDRRAKPNKDDIISERTTVKDPKTGAISYKTQKYPKGYLRVSKDGKRSMRNEGGHWTKYLRKNNGWYRLKDQSGKLEN